MKIDSNSELKALIEQWDRECIANEIHKYEKTIKQILNFTKGEEALAQYCFIKGLADKGIIFIDQTLDVTNIKVFKRKLILWQQRESIWGDKLQASIGIAYEFLTLKELAKLN